jgi:chromate transporter
MVPVREVTVVFLLLGTVAFGGPAAHVALMRRIIVQRLRWIDEDQFFQLFAACNLIPGPSSTELAIILGYKRAGKWGLLLAGTCFIAPAMVIMIALAFLYQRYGGDPTARHLLMGISAVVVGILAWAVVDVGRRLIGDLWAFSLALAAAVALILDANPLPILIAGAAVYATKATLRASAGKARTLTALLAPAGSTGSILSSKTAVLFVSFLKLGFIAFGSGYVLLVFLRSEFVTNLHWLTQRQVVDAVAISQATPGPVFTTATFIGYLVAGIPGALLATLAIFAPAFILVPPLERFVRFVRRHVTLAEALKGVNLAALGLIAGVSFEVARTSILSLGAATVAAVTFVGLSRQPLAGPVAVVLGALLGVAWPGLFVHGLAI